MGRQVLPLTVDRLAMVPDPCATCTFWELAPAQSAQPALRSVETKRGWLTTVLFEWGTPGRIALVDDNPAGYIAYAPPHLVPRALAFPTAPVSEDAIVLLTARIRPAYADQGLGRVLVQAAAKDALRRGVRAIEAFATTEAHVDGPLKGAAASSHSSTSRSGGRRLGAAGAGRTSGARRTADRKGVPSTHELTADARNSNPVPDDAPSGANVQDHESDTEGTVPGDIAAEGPCLLPVDFLTAVGFYTVREHACYPRMRLDLRTALRWREEVEQAVERLFSPVRSFGRGRPVGTLHRGGALNPGHDPR